MSGEGAGVGVRVGCAVGAAVGCAVGATVGCDVGDAVGTAQGGGQGGFVRAGHDPEEAGRLHRSCVPVPHDALQWDHGLMHSQNSEVLIRCETNSNSTVSSDLRVIDGPCCARTM